MASEVPASSAPSSQKGIDIHKALDILSLRSPHDHEGHHDHTGHDCQKHVPEGGKGMGQTLDLAQTEEDANSITESMEKQRQEIQDQRRNRELEIRAELESMTVRELLAAVMEAQTGRVETYREYDEGLETVLKTANVTNYPALCAKATASFSVLSDTISTIQKILEDKHERKDLTGVIATLQGHEREKLNVTAALHLERIREQNQSIQTTGGDERVMKLLKEGVSSMRQRIRTCVEAINEVLEELRYAVAEEE